MLGVWNKKNDKHINSPGFINEFLSTTLVQEIEWETKQAAKFDLLLTISHSQLQLCNIMYIIK